MNDQELPAGWVTTTLDNLCLPVDKVAPKDAPDQPFTYLDITSIDNTTFRVVSPKTYMGRDAPSRARQKVSRGNILFSTVRTYLKNIAMVPPEFDGEVASTGFCVLNPAQGIDQKFIFYLVLNDEFISNLNPLQRGTSYPAVRNDDVLAQEILLPPLPEQHRIVAAIEQHLTRLAAAVTVLKRVQANLQRYRTSVLKSACEGKLVPTEAALARAAGRDYEHADCLLARILVERRARWQAQQKRRCRYKEPAPPDTSALPELPEGWVWASLGSILDIVRGISFPKDAKQLEPREGLIACLRTANVQREVDWSDTWFVPMKYVKSEEKYIQHLDILMSISNSLKLLGKVVQVTSLPYKSTLGAFVSALRSSPGIDPKFCYHQLLSPDVQAKIRRSASTTTNISNISSSRLSDIVLKLPPLPEQHRIVAEVERRLSVVQQAETAVETSLKRAERLRQSILKQAFSGQLVPQDPNDEPAAVLLARIQAQRAAAETAAKARRKPRRRRARPAAAKQLRLAEGTP